MKTLMRQRKIDISSPNYHPQSLLQTLEANIEMREPTTDSAVAYAIALLSHYGFELRGYTAQELVDLWLPIYPASWVRLAVIEALYQGRYKAVSVDQILGVWARRGQPFYRFTHEFERLISRKLPQHWATPSDASSAALTVTYPDPPFETTIEPAVVSDTLLEAEATEASQVAPQQIEEFDAVELVSLTSSPDATTTLELQPPTSASPVNPEPAISALTSAEALPEISAPLNEPLSPPFAPAEKSSAYNADWSRCETVKQPIHQFTPPPDYSGFDRKLKAIVQPQEFTSADIVNPVEEESESPRLELEDQ